MPLTLTIVLVMLVVGFFAVAFAEGWTGRIVGGLLVALTVVFLARLGLKVALALNGGDVEALWWAAGAMLVALVIGTPLCIWSCRDREQAAPGQTDSPVRPRRRWLRRPRPSTNRLR